MKSLVQTQHVEAKLSQGSGFNVQFGGRLGSTKPKWRIEKICQCLNVAVTYRATPNIEITTIGGLHHAMQSFKAIIIDRFKIFHGVKVHFNVKGTSCLLYHRWVIVVGVGKKRIISGGGWNCFFSL